ncbi:MAG: hypothetical protein HQL51_09885 [Magnetococcales bacterium]|nr:hypothetical protein [Magnetococcales bacterium]
MSSNGHRGWRDEDDLAAGCRIEEPPCQVIPFPLRALGVRSTVPGEESGPRGEILSFSRFLSRRRRRYWRH